MSRTIIMAGRLTRNFQKPQNIKIIIKKINKIKINKNQKYILFLAAIRIIEEKKQNIRLLSQLEEMKSEKEIINNFTKSKYITNIIEYLKTLDSDKYFKEIDNLITFVNDKKIEI